MDKIRYFTNKPSAVLVPEEIALSELSATENKTYTAEAGSAWDSVVVSVTPDLESGSATANGTYRPTEGKDGFSDFTVAVPETVLVPKTITQNGVYDPAQDSAGGYSKVTVNVSSTDLPTLYAPRLSNGTIAYPLVLTPGSSNGSFVSAFVFTINGVDLSISGSGTTSSFIPWIYSITPIAGGTFAVSCRCTGTGFNDSVATSGGVTIPSATTTAGYSSVAGLGSRDPSTLTYTYDTNFPRSFQEVQDTYGNKFIKIPTIYRKILTSSDGQITSYALATSAVDSDYKPYPCFIDETNGNAILPFVLFGVYCVSNTGTANSVNASPASMDFANARTLCRNRGVGYQQYDWKFEKLFKDLGVVLSRYININNSQTIYDIMGIKHQTNYIWVDGVCRGSTEAPTAWYVCETEANYQNGGGGTSQSTTVAEADILSMGYAKLAYSAPSGNEYIAKLGYDADHPFLNYPDGSRANAGSSSTFYCDQYFQTSGCRPVLCCVGSLNGTCGWFYCNTSDVWSGPYAARLCYRPILGATGYTE